LAVGERHFIKVLRKSQKARDEFSYSYYPEKQSRSTLPKLERIDLAISGWLKAQRFKS
jgi:hypothetical protein